MDRHLLLLHHLVDACFCHGCPRPVAAAAPLPITDAQRASMSYLAIVQAQTKAHIKNKTCLRTHARDMTSFKRALNSSRVTLPSLFVSMSLTTMKGGGGFQPAAAGLRASAAAGQARDSNSSTSCQSSGSSSGTRALVVRVQLRIPDLDGRAKLAGFKLPHAAHGSNAWLAPSAPLSAGGACCGSHVTWGAPG